MSKKFYYIYKTVNIKTNEYYIGMHSTNFLEDGYLGSGNKLKVAIKKYGKENFQRYILEFCDNLDMLKIRESQIITPEVLSDPNCMNLAEGGQGGDINPWTEKSRKLLSENLKKRKNTWGKKVSLALKGRKQPRERVLKAAESRRGSRNGSWKNIDIFKILEYRKEGLSTVKIAQLMNISNSSVKRILRNNKNITSLSCPFCSS